MKTKNVLFSELELNDKFISDGLLYVKTGYNDKLTKPNNAVCQSKRIPCYVPADAKVVKIKEAV